jgi:hypothetical protein
MSPALKPILSALSQHGSCSGQAATLLATIPVAKSARARSGYGFMPVESDVVTAANASDFGTGDTG